MAEKKSPDVPTPESPFGKFPAPLVGDEFTVFPYNPNTPGPAPNIDSYNHFITSLVASRMSKDAFPSQPPASHGNATPGPSDSSTSVPMKPDEQYDNAFATAGYHQRNGRVIQVDEEMAARLSMDNLLQTNPITYNNSTKLGYGDQHNGNVIEFEGRTDYVMPSLTRDKWNNPMALSWLSPGSGPVIFGTQHNGPIMRTKK
nr:hypothetical protein FVER53263_06748 [Fusarium verticillioides]